ncbi:methyltransferase domain-containing protein [Streptomyces xiamenensis]|uniref:methyltransferase domain-containing protein n=1 Tax=Streptomyces TaxID=1883 RepID=UPI0004CB67C8|nr:methyltransferase domain-containing protein [Streptomyces sp. NRRL F-2890]
MNSTTVTARYLHGYSAGETRRLGDQANSLADLLHHDTRYPAGSRVLEAGCGVGAQTVHLLAGSPGIRLTAVDISAESLATAGSRVAAGFPDARVAWLQADLHELPFPPDTFDHVFVCFVLEHQSDPGRTLAALRRVLRPGGTLTVIEGDHGTIVAHPESAAARAVIGHLVRLQAAAGGNALLGRTLQPLLTAAGFTGVEVTPRTLYADSTRPRLMDSFTRDTFIAMAGSFRADALAAGLTTGARWDRGITELHRCATEGGTFQYSFFKATATGPAC